MGQRTPAMTTFGVMSVAMGVFFAVWSIRMLTMGGGATAAEAAGTAGGTAILIWLGALAASFLMTCAGAGCLTVAPWGWTAGMAASVAGLVAFGSWMWATSFGVLPAIAVGYTVVFGALIMSPGWKGALRGSSRTSRGAGAGQPSAQGKAAA